MSSIDSSIPVVVITGANRGIGLGFVKNLLTNTTKVNGIPDNAYVVATTRVLEQATDLKELQAAHARLHILQLDVASEESIAGFVSNFKQLGFERIDVLINNAGINNKVDTLENFSVEDYMESHLVNAIGPLRLTNALLDILKHTHVLKGGKLEAPQVTDTSDSAVDDFTQVRIQFISSMMGSIGGLSSVVIPIYRTSKTSLNMLASMFAKQHPYFAVVIQHPGWVETRMGGQGAPLVPDDSAHQCLESLNQHGYVSQSANRLWSVDGTYFPW